MIQHRHRDLRVIYLCATQGNTIIELHFDSLTTFKMLGNMGHDDVMPACLFRFGDQPNY